MRLQKYNVDDPTGIHDLAPVIAAGQYVYVYEYITILRPIPASKAQEEFWILTGSNPANPDQATKVLFHKVVPSLSIPAARPGDKLHVKIDHFSLHLPANEVMQPVLLKSRFRYAGITKTKELAALVCDVKKIHCHL